MDPALKDNLFYYLHNLINLLVTVSIFALLFLIASRVFSNLTSLLSIITI